MSFINREKISYKEASFLAERDLGWLKKFEL